MKDLQEFYRHQAMRDGRINFCKECKRAEANAHRSANIERYREYDRARGFRSYDKQKDKARRKVNHEIAAGRMERGPCRECGEHGAEAHHIDYNRPLDVVWLCKKHHAEAHRI